jgi:hypothetical protein
MWHASAVRRDDSVGWCATRSCATSVSAKHLWSVGAIVITASLCEQLRRDGRLAPSPHNAQLLAISMLRPCTKVHK